ncbi:MAG: hypothetical protein AAF501_11835 [Pseudomonadota bacterium]
MAKSKDPTRLDDADLDQAAGGYQLKKVFVTSYQTSGSVADAPKRPDVVLRGKGEVGYEVDYDLEGNDW